MAYVYADIKVLAAYQQQIFQTLSELEKQVESKEELIENTRRAIYAALGRAETAEYSARVSLQNAEEQLSRAEQQTYEYNSNLAEDQKAIQTPGFYYDTVKNLKQEYASAESERRHAQQTLADFEAYVCNYRQLQKDGVDQFKKLLFKSGNFFEQYIAKLIEVKKCTDISGQDLVEQSGSCGAYEGGVAERAAAPTEPVMKYGEQWANSLSKKQRRAISAYTDLAYININATLRGVCDSFEPGQKENARLIHEALADASIPQKCTVYRGVTASALGNLKDAPDDQLIGSYFNDPGFMSTSINRDGAFGGEIKLIIEVPAGARGVYVGYLSKIGHNESEVLFDMGAVMQITKVERSGTRYRVIYARMIV